MIVDVRCETGRGRAYARRLSNAARRLLALLSCGKRELSILLVDDPVIWGLNRKYRGKDAPTDVLSFPSSESGVAPVVTPPPHGRRGRATASPPLVLGDVVISVETALRQAHALGVRPAERLRTLLIHGVLHLLGYDHERSPADARRMFARERELAARLEASSGRRGAARHAPLPADPQWPPAAATPLQSRKKAARAGARPQRGAPAPARKPRRAR